MTSTFDEFTGPVVDKARAEAWEIGHAQGQLKGWRRALMIVLEARGLAVTDEVRERISSCTDIERIGTWTDRAVEIDWVEAVFGE
ncbi:hypothetical protein [Nocardia sp. NPDC052566]|uniref:hypothetical protein n=1 Tax=Nocardia sp. NPDC052566 TaxID=3364330 RepID=UPI0037CA7EED